MEVKYPVELVQPFVKPVVEIKQFLLKGVEIQWSALFLYQKGSVGDIILNAFE